MTTTAIAMRRYAGPAVFSFGFRPFFLFAALWSAVSVPVWIASLAFGDGLVGGVDGRLWHIHEMLFGYLSAVIAGFLLTAVPNWTGRLPVVGAPLAALFGLWAAGRVAGLIPEGLVPDGLRAIPASVDSAFLVAFAAVVWREVLAGKNRRNLPVCLMVSLLALANIAFHLRGLAPALDPGAHRAALAVAIALITLIGGRIIPSFTRNWTTTHGVNRHPAIFAGFDKLAVAVTVAALAGWVLAGHHALTGAGLIAAGGLNLARLARWRGWTARSEPLVWILHLGYAWVGVGLVLIGGSILAPRAIPFTAGVHALTAGAIGVMTLAVMTRATLGHTGRPRIADRATTAIYLCVLLAAVVRVAAPFAPSLTMAGLHLSAGLWSLAFLGFVLHYGPMLWRPSR